VDETAQASNPDGVTAHGAAAGSAIDQRADASAQSAASAASGNPRARLAAWATALVRLASDAASRFKAAQSPRVAPPPPDSAGDRASSKAWETAGTKARALFSRVRLPSRSSPPARPAPSYTRLAVRAVGFLAVSLVAAVLALAVLYRWINPPISTLMLGQSIAGTSIERTWVPLDRISPALVEAVVLSEDGRFCTHHGVDWGALQQAMEHDRGGSTITMQVVKNLFLWPSRSYVRKVIEIGLAYLVEAVWPKQRILEIYLNIAEWGDGVFGAEAAAQTNFGKSAARLTTQEAALLAVALPNPIERTPGSPDLVTDRLAGRLLLRMATSRASLACVRTARQASAEAQRAAPQPAPRPAPKPGQKQDWDHLFPGRD
jgi:monofunctional biosynthetic peptidoglycan transglycosylase